MVATATFFECSETIPDSNETTVSVALGEEKLVTGVIRNSGVCKFEIRIQNGPTETHTWTVGERSLHIYVEPDGITFTRERR